MGDQQELIARVVEVLELLETHLSPRLTYDEYVTLNGLAGANERCWDPVKPGLVLVLTHMSAYNADNALTLIRLGVYNGHRRVYLKAQPAPMAQETVGWDGHLMLGEGMYPVVEWSGVTADDDLHALAWGYWIDRR